jgi:hypothetical protein
LSRLDERLPGERPGALAGGPVADWNLDDDLWSRLIREDDGGMLLSGKAAARLLDARRETARTVYSAQGREARFSPLVPADRKDPTLTRFQLYWETIERVLGNRPLTILDPQATGRTHLFMADPERFNLNPMLSPPALPPAVAPTVESPLPEGSP